MRKKSIIIIIVGALITVLSGAMPYIVALFNYLFTGESLEGVGIIGGASWPTWLFRAKACLGSIPTVIIVLGFGIVLVGIVLLVVSKKRK